MWTQACASIHLPGNELDKNINRLSGEIQRSGSSMFQGSHSQCVISPSHISNFPSLTLGGQLLLHTQPQLFLRPPSNTVISRQSLAFYEASLARERWCWAIR